MKRVMPQPAPFVRLDVVQCTETALESSYYPERLHAGYSMKTQRA